MSYDEYDPSKVESGGNLLILNPDGIDPLAKTVVEGSVQYVCKKCGKPLDRWDNGMWVPKYPDRTKYGDGVRGYMISQLNAVWISASELKRKELNSKSKQAFHNYTIGVPYENQNMAVTTEDVFNNVYDHVEPKMDRDGYRFISVGVDWGNFHWISVLGVTDDGKEHLLRLMSVEKPSTTDMANIGADLEQIKLLIAPYKPDIIVADIGDSGDRIARLMAYYGSHMVYGCKYKSSPRSTGQIVPSWSDNTNTVTVDKLMQNKRYIGKLKAGEILHYRNQKEQNLNLYIEHWKNVIIRDEEDLDTGDVYEIIMRRGDDHFAQSSVYAMLGMDRLRDNYAGSNQEDMYMSNIDMQYLPDTYNDMGPGYR